MKYRLFFLFLIWAFWCQDIQSEKKSIDDSRQLRLKVSENKRFLQYEDGRPFFYLGDTAWELFHRLNREEADLYLKDRADKGFTVIQAVALSELDGYKVPNAYGYLPLRDNDPACPAVTEGANNDYWDHVDYIIDKANSLGLYVGLLPTWGRYWHDNNFAEKDNKPLFDVNSAKSYGRFVGRRYKDKQIIWILGGDRNVENENQKEIIRAMAEGIKEMCGDAQLITFHPRGSSGSSQWFHDEEWLDFNMRQNGHTTNYTGAYSETLKDYKLMPVKPVIDGEPLYEDHPINFDAGKLGHSVAADIRKMFYWDVFNGAFGHTYGHHSIWQMYDPQKRREPVNTPLMSWQKALNQPGARQMLYGRRLIESRPFYSRVPALDIIVPDDVKTFIPGEGRYRFVATKDENGTYAMVYVPVSRSFRVNLKVLKASKINAWWYNPRNGKAKRIGTFTNNQGLMEFTPPYAGELLDWVLVLDDAACKYPKPGERSLNT